MYRPLRALALALALGFSAPLAHAAAAEDFVKSKQAELTNLVKKTKTPAEEKKLESAFDEVLDYEVLAQAALKDYWAERTPEERTEFQGLLKKLVRAAYRKSLKSIANYDVEYRGETAGEAGQVVRTVAKHRDKPREEPVSIHYVVREAGGKWRIVDIVTEGSSLVSNYRSQFRRIIKKQGFPELLKRMKAKSDKGSLE